jgi:hypothetical protein
VERPTPAHTVRSSGKATRDRCQQPAEFELIRPLGQIRGVFNRMAFVGPCRKARCKFPSSWGSLSLVALRDAENETVIVESSTQGRESASASRCPSRSSSQKRARALAARRSAGLFWDHRQNRDSASQIRFHMSVPHRRRRGRLFFASFASRPPRRAGSRCRACGCLQSRRSCATLPRRLARQSARSCRRSACSWSRCSARDRPPACPEA